MNMTEDTSIPNAAASGTSATNRFHADKSPFEAVKNTPKERAPHWPERCSTRFTTRSAANASPTTSTTP